MTTHRLTPIYRCLLSLVAGAYFCGAALANDADSPHVTEQMRADCRAEGEAGGLQGAELEDFIRGCIDDLLSVEVENVATE